MIDILKDEYREYQEKLYLALKKGEALVAPSVVYAELMPQFKGNTKMLDTFLKDHKITVEPLDTDAVAVAANGWMKYLKRKTKTRCPNCNLKLNLREHFLSDFYVGGFASVKCNAILTRDRGIFTKYFPNLTGYKNCLKK